MIDCIAISFINTTEENMGLLFPNQILKSWSILDIFWHFQALLIKTIVCLFTGVEEHSSLTKKQRKMWKKISTKMMKMTTSKFVFKLCLSLVCHFVSPGLSFQPEFVRSFLSRPWMLSNQSLNDPITGKIGFLFGYMFLGLGRIRVSKRSSINFDYFLLFI